MPIEDLFSKLTLNHKNNIKKGTRTWCANNIQFNNINTHLIDGALAIK
jgi:hypothetical protein